MRHDIIKMLVESIERFKRGDYKAPLNLGCLDEKQTYTDYAVMSTKSGNIGLYRVDRADEGFIETYNAKQNSIVIAERIYSYITVKWDTVVHNFKAMNNWTDKLINNK